VLLKSRIDQQADRILSSLNMLNLYYLDQMRDITLPTLMTMQVVTLS